MSQLKLTGGLDLLSSLLHSGSVSDFINSQLSVDILTDESAKTVLEFTTKHLVSTGKLPSPETVALEVGVKLEPVNETFKYYLRHVENNYVQTSLRQGVMEMKKSLESGAVDDALKRMTSCLSGIHLKKQRKSLIDFRQASKLLMHDYAVHHKGIEEIGVSLGWSTPDAMMNGMLGGDLISFVGRPAMGKTWKVLYAAHNAWWEQKKSVLVVSMEMKPLPIMQRLIGMHSHLNMGQLKSGQLSTTKLNQFKHGLSEVQGHAKPFWVVDGNLSATVDDILMLVHELGPDVVYIDGAYLLRHPNPRVGRYEKVAENTEALKQRVATDCNIPVVCSFQFNRDATKGLKKGERPGLEHIAYSDVIGQISSVVFGIFEEESAENSEVRKIDILKGRNGEQGEFFIKWDFEATDFREVQAPNLTAIITQEELVQKV